MSAEAGGLPHASRAKVIPVPSILLGTLVVLTILLIVFTTGMSIVTNPPEIGGPPYP